MLKLKPKPLFIVVKCLLIVNINVLKSEMIPVTLNTIKNYNSNINNSIQDIDDNIYSSYSGVADNDGWNFHHLLEHENQLFKIIQFYLCNQFRNEFTYKKIISQYKKFNNHTTDDFNEVNSGNDEYGARKSKIAIGSSNVVITEIFDDLKKFNKSDSVTDIFMKIFQTELFQPTMLKKIYKFSKDQFTTLAATYSWYDDNYKLNVSSQFLKYNLVNNNISSIFNSKIQKSNSNNLIIVKNLDILKTFLRVYMPRYPFNEYTTRKQFIMFIVDKIAVTDTNTKKLLNRLVQRIWKNYGILNFIIIINNNNTNYLYGIYMPFIEKILWLTCEELLEKKIMLDDKLRDYHNFKVYFTVFERHPTMLRKSKLPKNYVEFDQNFVKIKKLSNGYGGLDGMVLGNLAKALNFNPVTRIPPDGDYGYKFDNGTFTGTIGDLLYRRADISINGRFIKYYDTNEIEFTISVYFDKLCVISPKALKIPQWLAIFVCYHPYVWLIIIFTNIFCGYFWYFLKECTAKFEKRIKTKRKSDNLLQLLIEMWLILSSAPSNKMPSKLQERIFISTCLLANLIITGTFQGSLTTAFSTTSFYKDINTLEELDKSGIPIGTQSRGLSDIFGKDGGPLLTSLNNKYHILNEPAVLRTAYQRDYCCVERYNDLKLLIHEYYENFDGTPMIHPIKECPRSYYLAYIVKKGWPFLNSFNRKLRQFYEAGLLVKWYLDAEYSRVIDRKFQNKFQISKIQAFSMQDMQTAFFILSGGILISTFTFLVECFIGRQTFRLSKEKKSAWFNSIYHTKINDNKI